MAYGEYYVERQGWAHWPKTLIMCRKTGYGIERRRYVPDATLGRGECHNVSKVVDEHGQARFVCSGCGAWLDSRMLWNPEYPNGESPWVKDCSLNFCPNCGAKVVSE